LSVDEYGGRLDSLNRLSEEIESALNRRSAIYRQQMHRVTVSAESVRQALPDGATLIEYFQYSYLDPLTQLGEERYLCVVSGQDSTRIFDLGAAKQIERAIDKYRGHLLDLAYAKRAPTPVDVMDYRQLAHRLYALVVPPLASSISDTGLVLIAPDGGLNLVSFAGLIDDDGKYMIERQPLHYLSTSPDLLRLSDSSKSTSGLLALGDPDYDASAEMRVASIPDIDDPADLTRVDTTSYRATRFGCTDISAISVSALPGTGIEVRKIAETYHEQCEEDPQVLTGADASEDALRMYGSGKEIIHLATHGFFLQNKCESGLSTLLMSRAIDYAGENPMLLSGLLLAGANLHGAGAAEFGVEDGVVTAEEVSSLNLHGTHMVVLSACETGLGKVEDGEGVYGLRRAFQVAGARTVISALWPVSDVITVEIMKHLYSEAHRALPTRMRQAQLKLIEKGRSEKAADHPIFWASFIASGAWE